MEKIIKRAIEGGYNIPHHSELNGTMTYTKEHLCVMYLYKLQRSSGSSTWEEARDFYKYEKLILDPRFWQALGKACGWGIQIKEYKGDVHVNHHFNGGKCTEMCVVPSTKVALRFQEINLTEGWDKAVEYLEDLIKE